MPTELIRHGFSPTGAPILHFAGRTFMKFGPTRQEDVLGTVARLPRNSKRIAELLVQADEIADRVNELLKLLVFDGPTLHLVERVLIAIERDEPLLIEGEPATAKTVGALLAGSLLGLRCFRVNFSGMTQVDDFLGRFVPATDGSIGGFTWVDGAATTAARQGGLFLLDEPNLAPPPILDRLLPLLDSKFSGRAHAEFVLQERGREVILISPNLRVISAMNGAHHTGRRKQSGAFFSRHTTYETTLPNEEDVSLMLRHLTTTEPLLVTHRGQQYVAPGTEMVAVPEVDRLPDWRSSLLPSLAKFFVSLGYRCHEGSIGRDRRDPYAFDRRRLYSFLKGIGHELVDGGNVETTFREEFERHFLDSVASEDRPLVADLAKSHNLLSDITAVRNQRSCRRRADKEVGE